MLRERFETADLINVIQLGTKRPLCPKYGNHFVVASLINPEHYAKPRKLSGEWRRVNATFHLQLMMETHCWNCGYVVSAVPFHCCLDSWRDVVSPLMSSLIHVKL